MDNKTLADAEKGALIAACKAHPTSQAIANALGVSRATLYRLLKKHGLTRPEVTNG